MRSVGRRRVRRIRPYGCTNEEIAAACRHRTRVRLRRLVLQLPPNWPQIGHQIWKLYLYEAYCVGDE